MNKLMPMQLSCRCTNLRTCGPCCTRRCEAFTEGRALKAHGKRVSEPINPPMTKNRMGRQPMCARKPAEIWISSSQIPAHVEVGVW